MTIFVNFFLHCEDFISSQSIWATKRAAELFARYGLKADFFLTGLVAEKMVKEAPQTIATLKRLNMPISYHADIHAPFPTLTQRVRDLDWDSAVMQTLKQENSHLDPFTGDLTSQNPNQMGLICQLFEKPPLVTIGAAGGHAAQAIRFAHHRLGVPMASTNGSMLGLPLIWHNGMLRGLPGPGNYFYLLDTAGAKPGEREKSQQLEYILEAQIASVPAERDSLISLGVHDFSFALTDGWIGCFRDPDSGRYRNPRALWSSSPMTGAEQEQIWRIYEKLIAFCARNPAISVITAEDMLSWVQLLADKRIVHQGEILAIAKQLVDGWAGPGYPPDHTETDMQTFSLVDSFQTMVQTLAYFGKYGNIPENIEIRELLGPTDTPVGLAFQKSELRPRQIIDGAVVIARSIELAALMDDRIPGTVYLDTGNKRSFPMFKFGLTPEEMDGTLNPAEFLYLTAQVVQSLFMTGKPGQAFLMASTMFPYLPVFRWVENRFPPFAISQEEYTMQEWMSELQSWTIKPARLKNRS